MSVQAAVTQYLSRMGEHVQSLNDAMINGQWNLLGHLYTRPENLRSAFKNTFAGDTIKGLATNPPLTDQNLIDNSYFQTYMRQYDSGSYPGLTPFDLTTSRFTLLPASLQNVYNQLADSLVAFIQIPDATFTANAPISNVDSEEAVVNYRYMADIIFPIWQDQIASGSTPAEFTQLNTLIGGVDTSGIYLSGKCDYSLYNFGENMVRAGRLNICQPIWRYLEAQLP